LGCAQLWVAPNLHGILVTLRPGLWLRLCPVRLLAGLHGPAALEVRVDPSRYVPRRQLVPQPRVPASVLYRRILFAVWILPPGGRSDGVVCLLVC
jgi:hypothetical protein